MNKEIKSNYKFGMSEEECGMGNIVADAFDQLPFNQFKDWVNENWDKMSEYEMAVVEGMEYEVGEILYPSQDASESMHLHLQFQEYLRTLKD